MKKVLAFALTVVLTVCLTVGVLAATGDVEISVLLCPGVSIALEGEVQTLTDANGKVVYPIIYEGTTYVPVRGVGKLFGVYADWDNATRTVKLSKTPFTGQPASPSPAPGKTGGSSVQSSQYVLGVYIGDSPDDVEDEIGAPYRTIKDSKIESAFYYTNKGNFVMVQFDNSKVVFVYSLGSTTGSSDRKIYKDNIGGSNYAASVGNMSSVSVSTTEQMIFEITNAFREENGLDALDWNNKLGAAARAHSEDMADRKFFDHTNPDGDDPFDRMDNEGYSYWTAGENICAGSANAVEAMEGWINSSGHRSNILAEDFEEFGAGWAVGGSMKTYGTQCFGAPQ
ncbi:MAG: CAP domain-containing protein [Oscillospiraceae bacterium]|jgi:uncharacterized protein YkwD|nr:CAP domain-containing protein [Oscillospiraceae bacterium]